MNVHLLKKSNMSATGGGAFGSGKAGAPFDPLQYIKKPQVILRIVSVVGAFLLWTVLWNVGFVYLSDAWRRTDKSSEIVKRGNDHVQTAIAFTFFSVFSWGGLSFLALRRLRQGVQEAFATGYDQDPKASSPYSSFPGSDTGDPYQQPPFSQQKETPDYQQPTY